MRLPNSKSSSDTLLAGVFVTTLTALTWSGTLFAACSQETVGQTQTIDKLDAVYANCLKLKDNELYNFQYKRNRYMRMIDWAGEVNLKNALIDEINSIREIDVLIDNKLKAYSSCVSALPREQDLTSQVNSNLSCASQVGALNTRINNLRSAVKSCQSCSLSSIAAINDSALELLVAQRHNSHKIRRVLYNKLATSQSWDLVSQTPWLVIRDIFLPYIADISLSLSNSQKLIVVLEQMEQITSNKANLDASTDEIMGIYEQLATILKSDDEDQTAKLSKQFWHDYLELLKKNKSVKHKKDYSGFRSDVEFVNYIRVVRSNFSGTLLPVLNTAISKYKSIRH